MISIYVKHRVAFKVLGSAIILSSKRWLASPPKAIIAVEYNHNIIIILLQGSYNCNCSCADRREYLCLSHALCRWGKKVKKSNCTMVASAAVFLRRLALPSTSKSTRYQLRLASTISVRSAAVNSASPLRNASAAGVASSTCRSLATMSAGDALARLASDHPHQEIIRYEHKNVKWTLKHVNYYSDALACGLVDAGLQPGDVMLSWLPLHVAEQVRVAVAA